MCSQGKATCLWESNFFTNYIVFREWTEVQYQIMRALKPDAETQVL